MKFRASPNHFSALTEFISNPSLIDSILNLWFMYLFCEILGSPLKFLSSAILPLRAKDSLTDGIGIHDVCFPHLLLLLANIEVNRPLEE